MIPAFGMVIFWSCILSVGTSQVGHDDSVNRDESLVVMVLTPGGGQQPVTLCFENEELLKACNDALYAEARCPGKLKTDSIRVVLLVGCP